MAAKTKTTPTKTQPALPITPTLPRYEPALPLNQIRLDMLNERSPQATSKEELDELIQSIKERSD
jgi:hypothetical protein